MYGDSFTVGDEVTDEQAWASQLTTLLQCRVLNFGVGGFGTDQALMRYQSNRQYSNIVFLSHYSENIIRNINQFRDFIYPSPEFNFKPRYILEHDSLKLVPIANIEPQNINNFLDSPNNFLNDEYFLPNGKSGLQIFEFPYSIKLLKAIANPYTRAIILNSGRHIPFYNNDDKIFALDLTSAILNKFAQVAIHRGQRPIITIFPSCRDFQFKSINGYFPYVSLIKKLDISHLDFIDFGTELLWAYNGDFQNLYINCDAHFSPLGNKVIADIVANYLKTHPR